MLARLRKAKEEGEGGFTLIELLVVIIIIGILAAIAIPVFLTQRKKGVDASIKSDLRQIANEVESSFTDTQVYPTTQPAIKASKDNTFAYGVSTDGTYWCAKGMNAKSSATSLTNSFYLYVSNDGGLKGPVQTVAAPATCNFP